jgi:hypothetical protein
MNSLYAFVETWITSALGFEYEPYSLPDGKMVHIIDEDDFIYLEHFFTHIWGGNKDEVHVSQIGSCVSGMRLLLMRFWEDETILYSLTDGGVKEHSYFKKFMDMQYPRFSMNLIELRLLEMKEMHRLGRERGAHQHNNDVANSTAEVPASEDEAAIVEVVAPIPIPIETPKPVIPGEKYINLLFEGGPFSGYLNKKEYEGHYVITDSGMSSDRLLYLNELSKQIDRNIIYSIHFEIIMKTFKKSDEQSVDVAKHTIIINPVQNNGFYEGRSGLTICLGREVNKIFKVRGDNESNEKIKKINGDDRFSKEEKEEKIAKIYESRENSPFFKYDKIFKDFYTGTIWAVKDKNIIFLLFQPDNEKNNFFERAIFEIGNRFSNTLSREKLFEIDSRYFKEFSSSNMDSYVEYSMKSARSVFDGIKNLHEEQVSLFKKYTSLAMESAKLMSRYADQISAFDIKFFEEKEAEKARTNFNDTMEINKVNAVFIKNGTVHVYTKNLYAKDERTKKWHDIGMFHITIGMLDTQYDVNNTVRIYNTKYQGIGMSPGMQAPHVFEDGHACHGNLTVGVTEAYKNRNLFDLVYQILIFLQSANTGDGAGQYVNSWPEVSEQTALMDDDPLYQKTEEKSEVEQKFDDMLADAIPLNISI